MRADNDLRRKVKELEDAVRHIGWEEELLERETKVIARAKIWGILYAMGYAEEELVHIGFGKLPPMLYEVDE
jgi:hypothetical protein